MPALNFHSSNKSIEVDPDTNLLRTSIRFEGGVPYKCGGGICGTCTVLVVEGHEHLSKVMKKELVRLGQEKINQGFRLACQTFLTGDVTIAWGEDVQQQLNAAASSNRSIAE